MSKEHSRYRWFVVGVFFFFMLLHQTDKLMIGSLQVPISETFGLSNTQWGWINSGALVVATFLYPVWGYLYDRYARAKLLSLASLIWGATTWLNAIVRTFGGFLVTRASTGIDDSSYPGLYSLIADLWHSATCAANWLSCWYDPGVADRTHDRRLAFGVLHYRFIGYCGRLVHLLWREGNGAR